MNTAKNNRWQKRIYMKQMNSKLDEIQGLFYFVTKSFAILYGETIKNPLTSQGRTQFLIKIKVCPYSSQLAARNFFIQEAKHEFFLETLSLCYFAYTCICCLENTQIT